MLQACRGKKCEATYEITRIEDPPRGLAYKSVGKKVELFANAEARPEWNCVQACGWRTKCIEKTRKYKILIDG